MLAWLSALAIVQTEKEKVDDGSSAAVAVHESADLGLVSFQ